MTNLLATGTKIIDRDGFKGTITKITTHNGATWYDVRFTSGSAVRFPSEVKVAA